MSATMTAWLRQLAHLEKAIAKAEERLARPPGATGPSGTLVLVQLHLAAADAIERAERIRSDIEFVTDRGSRGAPAPGVAEG